MDFHNGQLFWQSTLKEDLIFTPSDKHAVYDVVIVGAGISGALVALQLVKNGLKIAILDKGIPGQGSTLANTGLLQYSNDIMLFDLIKQIGEESAVQFYKMCLQAMDDLREIVQVLPVNVDFINRPSICYSSKKSDAKKLKMEYETLKKHGFPCEFWDAATLKEKLNLNKAAALVTFGDAEINPYKFVLAILQKLLKSGVHIFPSTNVLAVEEGNLLKVMTDNEQFIAKNVIWTTGYDYEKLEKSLQPIIRQSYAMFTDVIASEQTWYENALIWETARPYLYIRTTVDGRIIVGGLDEKKQVNGASLKHIEKKAIKLHKQLTELFPNLNSSINYAYGAAFGESPDNLPFIGEHPKNKRQYYLLVFGGNGTVYSMIGSKIIAQLIESGFHPDAHIVKLDRS